MDHTAEATARARHLASKAIRDPGPDDWRDLGLIAAHQLGQHSAAVELCPLCYVPPPHAPALAGANPEGDR